MCSLEQGPASFFGFPGLFLSGGNNDSSVRIGSSRTGIDGRPGDGAWGLLWSQGLSGSLCGPSAGGGWATCLGEGPVGGISGGSRTPRDIGIPLDFPYIQSRIREYCARCRWPPYRISGLYKLDTPGFPWGLVFPS